MARGYRYAGSESLKAVFERALVLQRTGDASGALAEYEAFVGGRVRLFSSHSRSTASADTRL